MASNRNIRGVALALAGGISWGFSGSCMQFVFARAQIDALWAGGIAMLLAGIVLVCVALLRKRDELRRLWIAPRSVGSLLLFAVAGLMACRVTYLLAIQYSNAGTATVLQYVGPVLIVVATCFAGRRLPTYREVIAVLCVVAGVFLIATNGNPSTMVLSREGLFWGLVSAVTVVTYSMLPRQLMAEYGSIPTVGSAMLVAGRLLLVAIHAWNHVPQMDGAAWLALLGGLTFMGTVIGFTFYLQAVSDIGAARASLLASVEVVAATLFAAVWLSTAFTWIDLVGFVFIMATVFILSKKAD